MKRLITAIMALTLLLTLLAGCGSGIKGDDAAQPAPGAETAEPVASPASALPDGIYTADFKTDSGMFAVSEACNGKGTLTVFDGEMYIHVSLISKKILNLFAGTAEDAHKDGALLLEPTTDTVTYSDGLTEEVFGFDIPVPAIGEEFDVALVGTKGNWYDHKVSVENPMPQESSAISLEDGCYTCEVSLGGGSGRASVMSPAQLRVENGEVFATIVWSSSDYDYMLVDGTRYEPLSIDGGSTFEIPVCSFDLPTSVTADTVAMSTPHEIDYTLTFDSSSVQKVAE